MPLLRSAGGGQRAFVAAAAAFLLIAPFPSSAGWRVFLLLCCALALWLQARHGNEPLELQRVPRAFALAACAWIALCLASLGWSVDPAYTLEEARRELAYGVGAFLVFFIGTRSVARFRLWIAMLFLGILLLGLGEWLHMAFPGVWLFRKASMGPGPLSTHVLMLAPLLFVWAWRPPLGMGLQPWIVALAAVFLAAAGVAGESRMLWPALAIAAVVAFAVFSLQPDSPNASRSAARRAFLIALAIFPILLVVSAEYKLRYYPKAFSAAESIELDERPIIWRVAAAEAARRPWAGHGYGREIVASAINKGIAQAGLAKPLGHGHNVFLDTVIELGVAGIAAFAALIGALAAAYWRLRTRGDAALVAICGLAILAGYLAKNMTDDFFFRPNSLVFWAVNGMLLGIASRPSAWESPQAAASPGTGTPAPSA
jgi:O-antigen ligase